MRRLAGRAWCGEPGTLVEGDGKGSRGVDGIDLLTALISKSTGLFGGTKSLSIMLNRGLAGVDVDTRGIGKESSGSGSEGLLAFRALSVKSGVDMDGRGRGANKLRNDVDLCPVLDLSVATCFVDR
jgi:hypothetical protein